MENARKQYPTDEEVARVMAERKLNRIGAVQYLRRQSAKTPQTTQPSEPKAKATGRKLKYNPERILKLWEDGKSIREIAETMKPISSVFVHRTLTTKFRKQYDQGQRNRAAARQASTTKAGK